MKIIEKDNKKGVVYEDTFLTLSNYKEPLQSIPKKDGFGFYGVLLASDDGDKIQCHMCGKLYRHLGAHIVSGHKSNVRLYREQYQLAYQTALVSETLRAELKERTMLWLSKFTAKEKREFYSRISLSSKNKRDNFQPKLTLETKNKRGICPDQILEKIKQVTTDLGHVPSLAQFVESCGTQRYKHLVFKVYGSWNNALRILNMEHMPMSPKTHDRYTDEELLKYLYVFTYKNKKIPTATDFKRGLLPDYETYIRHFGTIEEARQQAGVYVIIKKPAYANIWKKKDYKPEILIL